jgi:ribosomal protein L37AE/L43A
MMTRSYRVKSRGDPGAILHRTYECPVCEGRFQVFERRSEHPRYCQCCGAEFAGRPEAVPGTRAIGGTTAARAVDFTYAQLEAAGQARMRLAERDGLPSKQARQLKITDMADSMREGDIAVKGPQPSVQFSQFQAAAAQKGINYGFLAGGAGGSVGPMIGPPGQQFVGPGHVAMHAFQQQHQENVRAVKLAGLMTPADRAKLRGSG